MTPEFREGVCRACEWYRQGLRKGCCCLVRDGAGRASTEKLEQIINGVGKCPIGAHEAARLLEGIQ